MSVFLPNNKFKRVTHFPSLPTGASRVTAVDGHYQIGIYSVRPIEYGEEITFDYNSVTEVCSSLSLLNIYVPILLLKE